jgi:lysophospholipid hydrolase
VSLPVLSFLSTPHSTESYHDSVASAATLEEAKKTPGCLYYAMPVQQFETLGGFSKFDEVFSVGLKAGREILSQWKEEGRLPTGLVDDVQAKSQAVKRGTRLRLVF